MNELTQHNMETIEGGNSIAVVAAIISAIVLLDNNWADIKQGFADGFNEGRDWATGKATEENDGTC
jgi:hypothetical protein